jgi:hypothetical protein
MKRQVYKTRTTTLKVNRASLACGPLVKCQVNYSMVLVVLLRDELQSFGKMPPCQSTGRSARRMTLLDWKQQITGYKGEDYAQLIAEAQANQE